MTLLYVVWVKIFLTIFPKGTSPAEFVPILFNKIECWWLTLTCVLDALTWLLFDGFGGFGGGPDGLCWESDLKNISLLACNWKIKMKKKIIKKEGKFLLFVCCVVNIRMCNVPYNSIHLISTIVWSSGKSKLVKKILKNKKKHEMNLKDFWSRACVYVADNDDEQAVIGTFLWWFLIEVM